MDLNMYDSKGKTLSVGDVIVRLLKATNSDHLRVGKHEEDGEVFVYKLAESQYFYEPWDEEEININYK